MPHAHWTHLALHVHDLEASIEFYTEFTGLRVIERHSDAISTGLNVAWLSDEEAGSRPRHVLVLLEGVPRFPPDARPQLPLGPMSHLGFGVSSREDVDRIAGLARAINTLVFGPLFLNENAGYLCVIADPDGHNVEFSHGQALGPAVVSGWLDPGSWSEGLSRQNTAPGKV